MAGAGTGDVGYSQITELGMSDKDILTITVETKQREAVKVFKLQSDVIRIMFLAR